MIDYDALSHDLDVDVDPSHDGLYDLFQSNPEADSKSKGKQALQPGHALPSALSPTASDPDSASDSSRSTAAMNNLDVNDVAMNGYFEFGEDPGMNWADLTIFNNDEVHDTINPAVIGQPMGMHMDLVDVSPGPSHDFSSPSDVNASPPAKYEPDDYLPRDSVSSTQDSPMHLHSPLSQGQGFARKRLSVCSESCPTHIVNLLISKQQASSVKSINGLHPNNSRDVSPTSHVVFSQGSSPFASAEAVIPDRNRLSRGNPPGGSWFNQPIPSTSTTQLAQQPTEPATPIATLLQQPTSVALRPTLTLFGIPPKSRVETQIHLKMALHPVPEGITKIRLPPYSIAKPKFRAKPSPLPQPDTLELFIQVVCTSAMEKPTLRQRALARAAASKHPTDVEVDPNDTPETGGEVRICGSCITREYKRVNRKKNKKPGEDVEWRKDESKRVIIFNTQEIKEWQHPGQEYMLPLGAMLADTPMRITCYCRHHSEKTGYQVIFTLKNHLGQVVTQALSQSIMITDDHKTPQGPSAVDDVDSTATGLNGVNDMNAVQPGQPFRLSQSTSDIQALKRSASALMPQPVASGSSTMRTSTIPTPRILSRPPSPTSAGPSAKKRKSSGTKIPSGLHMTRLETTNGFTSQPSNTLQTGQSTSSSSATSPFSPPSSIPFSDGTSGIFGQNPAAAAPLFPVGPQTPNGNDQAVFAGDAARLNNTDGRTMTPLYSAPPSAHTSRAPSPNGLRTGVLPHQSLQSLPQLPHSQLNQMPQTLPHGLPLSAPFANASQRRPPVQILKVVPPEGPMSGGIEVTVLGSGCCRDLDVFFGDTKATTTTFWGDSTLTCILPPYHQSGPVHVTVRGTNGQTQTLSRSPPMFVYKDETQDQLRDLAIDVLARKMMGKMANVKEFVTRIIGEHGMSDTSVNGGGFNGGAPRYNLNLETKLLKVLDLMDMDDSLNKARLNMSRKGGLQTMLHLSCALGFHRFTAGLLARGAKPDLQDVCGYTPLHYAAMHNHPELVRRLIQHKADPTLRTTAGLLASDVATTRDVIRAIKRAGRRGSNMHSRASSATSLRSFWDPSKEETPTTQDYSYDESSDEPATEADSSSDDDQHLWLDIAHRRVPRGHPARSSRASLADLPVPDAPTGLPPAMASFKDLFQQQFHQFQQNMMQSLHLPTRQNLPNIPYLPQMSNMDYQAWNAAQFMQRMSAYLPNIGSSPLPATAEALPPAYDDIFPGNKRTGKAVSTEYGGIGTKQASAAQAAVDYEADRKCASLYDLPQQTESEQTLSPETEIVQAPKQLPKLLQIGRKNNITKEQQDNLRQAHAQNLKNISRDRHLFFIWVSQIDVTFNVLVANCTMKIPMLLVITCAMLYTHFPHIFAPVITWATTFVQSNFIDMGRIVEV